MGPALLSPFADPVQVLTVHACVVVQRPAVAKQLEHVQYLSDFQELPLYVQLRAVQILRMHVMGNVRQRIEAGHRDFVNEIRVCTCLFLGFPSLKVIAYSSASVGKSRCILAQPTALMITSGCPSINHSPL